MKTTTIGIDLDRRYSQESLVHDGSDHVCVLDGEAYALISSAPSCRAHFGLYKDHCRQWAKSSCR